MTTHEITIPGDPPCKLFVTGEYFPCVAQTDTDTGNQEYFMVETVKTRCGDDITVICSELDLAAKVLAAIHDQQRGEIAENVVGKREEKNVHF